MSNAFFKATGIDKAISYLKQRKEINELDKAVEDIVRMCVSLMMRYAAVDTGEMMESITWHKNGQLDYTIDISSPHAIFNEYGTKYMPVGSVKNPIPVISTSGKSAYRPFIRPAIWQIMDMFPDMLGKASIKVNF